LPPRGVGGRGATLIVQEGSLAPLSSLAVFPSVISDIECAYATAWLEALSRGDAAWLQLCQTPASGQVWFLKLRLRGALTRIRDYSHCMASTKAVIVAVWKASDRRERKCRGVIWLRPYNRQQILVRGLLKHIGELVREGSWSCGNDSIQARWV
jgi:hypothetical protein